MQTYQQHYWSSDQADDKLKPGDESDWTVWGDWESAREGNGFDVTCSVQSLEDVSKHAAKYWAMHLSYGMLMTFICWVSVINPGDFTV